MTIYKPELVSGDKVPMTITNPRHLVSNTSKFSVSGSSLNELGDKTGAEAVLRSGSFENAMLQALDSVNQDQNESTDMMQTMVVDPDAVDVHDVTISMAKAYLSLNITRTVLDRIVTGWKDIINTR